MALLSSKELAAELHFTPKQIARLALRGEIPSMKFGSEYRFDLDEVKQARRYHNPVRQKIQEDAKSAATKAFWRLHPKRRTV